VPPDAPVSCERYDACPWLIIPINVEIAGAKKAETTATAGLAPSRTSATPPPSMLEDAVAVQFITPEEPGAIASKLNVTFCPGFITDPPPRLVSAMVVDDKV